MSRGQIFLQQQGRKIIHKSTRPESKWQQECRNNIVYEAEEM